MESVLEAFTNVILSTVFLLRKDLHLDNFILKSSFRSAKKIVLLIASNGFSSTPFNLIEIVEGEYAL